MDRSWLRAAQKLQLRDPAQFLSSIREFEYAVAQSATPYRVRALRTNKLKEARELRQAALFCHGLSERVGHKIYFARGEAQDYDFVASWVVGAEQHFVPVQLKEFVPEHVNPCATLESLLEGVRKYKASPDLTVAVHFNRNTTFCPETLTNLELPVASLWIFGAASPDQKHWRLWGNFLEDPTVSEFQYPDT